MRRPFTVADGATAGAADPVIRLHTVPAKRLRAGGSPRLFGRIERCAAPVRERCHSITACAARVSAR